MTVRDRHHQSTSRNVRTVAPGPLYGSLCPLCRCPLQAEGLLWRCPSATRHEPSGLATAASVETATGPPRPSGGCVCPQGLRSLTCAARVPLLPVSVHSGG